jgi:hypothetical protein
MVTTNIVKKLRTISTFTLVFCLLFSNNLLSQTKTESQAQLTENSLTNFISGIQSDNLGVKKCCIYFAGKYRLREAAQTLINEFDKSNNQDYESLIVWSLCRIGDEGCIDKLKKIMESHSRNDLKLFCSTLLSIKEYGSELEKPHL